MEWTKIYAYGNLNVNVNANFFEHELLGLAGARLFSITEKDRNNRKKQKFARWRSPLFFITEKDRNDRKKQKLLPAAGYGNANVNLNGPTATLTLTLTLTFLNTNCLGSLTLASLLHYRKGQK